MLNIGDKITQARKAIGISQEELAEGVGVSRQTISKWEKDKTRPDFEQFDSLAATLGVSYEWLLGKAVMPDRETNAIYRDIGLSEKAIKALRRDYSFFSDALSSVLVSRDFFASVAYMDMLKTNIERLPPDSFEAVETAEKLENLFEASIIGRFRKAANEFTGFIRWRKAIDKELTRVGRPMAKAAIKALYPEGVDNALLRSLKEAKKKGWPER